MPDKALLDTTILTNVLLKAQNEGAAALSAMQQYKETLLPQYAIKEFKGGPLRAYVWFHNKVHTCATWKDAVDAIPKLFMQRNKQSTAFQALAQFNGGIGTQTPASLQAKYPGQNIDKIFKDEGALWLKTTILRAWKKRRRVATRVVSPLTCYPEGEITIDRNGNIDDTPVVCGVADCCLRSLFTNRAADTTNLLNACDLLPEKEETRRRRKVLKELDRVPHRELSEKDCKSLGDAVFAMQCPQDAEILTTNLKDHDPLAQAVGRNAVSP